MICPQCGKKYDNGRFCLDCGIPLVFEQALSSSGFSLNLGDANAVSGGVNLSDNHSINTTNTHNVDSHNVITNNITQIEREKSIEEIKLDTKDLGHRVDNLEAQNREHDKTLKSLENRASTMEAFTRNNMQDAKKQMTSVYISMGMAVLSAAISFFVNLL